MGVPKKSRKGKKAWRKNIDASEVERFIEETTHQDRRGTAVEQLADEELFFVDKQADAEQVAKPLSKRQKRKEAKPTRAESILASISAGIQPVTVTARKPKGSISAKQQQQQEVHVPTAGKKRKQKRKPGANLTDIWSESPEDPNAWVQPPPKIAPPPRKKHCNSASVTAAAPATTSTHCMLEAHHSSPQQRLQPPQPPRQAHATVATPSLTAAAAVKPPQPPRRRAQIMATLGRLAL